MQSLNAIHCSFETCLHAQSVSHSGRLDVVKLVFFHRHTLSVQTRMYVCLNSPIKSHSFKPGSLRLQLVCYTDTVSVCIYVTQFVLKYPKKAIVHGIHRRASYWLLVRRGIR